MNGPTPDTTFWIGLVVAIALAVTFAEFIALIAILAIIAFVVWLFWSVVSQWVILLVGLAAIFAGFVALAAIVDNREKIAARAKNRPLSTGLWFCIAASAIFIMAY